MKPSILLRTKFLVPQPSSEHLPRPHLVTWLENHVSRRLVLLSAPPGYGKTTLLGSFLATLTRAVAWYQLDSADSDPTIFLTYLIEALRRAQSLPGSLASATGRTAQALLDNSESNATAQQVLTVLLNELSEVLDTPCLIVLDDYHFITSPAVHQLVNFLLENAPPNFHIILSTRVDPPLALSRLRARGLLAELRTAELRFREDEVEAWLARNSSVLDKASASLLSEKTEGWAAAIQMVLSSFTGQNAETAQRVITGLSGSHRYIFEYLAEEVFHRQQFERQTFLLHTAILNQMEASACEALPGITNAQAALDHLERDNLFITSLDPQRHWYRYHFLFREFLLGKLRREQPEKITALHLAAGVYYENQGELEASYNHYIEALAFPDAVRVIDLFAPGYIERGRLEVMHRYLSQLPDDLLNAQPSLLLYHGQVHRRMGDAVSAIAAFEHAQAAYQSRNDPAGVSRTLTRLAEINRAQGNYRQAEILASQALSVTLTDDHAGRAEALMALAKATGFLSSMDKGRMLAEQAVEEARLAGNQLTLLERANFTQSLGQMCWWHGDPHAAVRHCQEALQLAPEKFSPLAAQAYISLVTPHLYWRDIETAVHYAEQGLEIAQQLHLNELLPAAYMALGNVLTRRGESTRAEAALRQALEIAQRQGLSAYEQVMAAGYLAYNLYNQGRVEEARQIAESALWAYTGSPDTYEAYVCRSVLADVALEMNQLDQAEELFEGLVKVGERRQFRIPLALVYFGLAYILIKRGDHQKGLSLALQSLELMEPSGAIQLFLDQGERASHVFNTLANTGVKNAFLDRLLENLPHAKNLMSLGIVSDSPASGVVVRALGTFRVMVDNLEIQQERWVSTKARDLLGYFVTFRSEHIPVDRAFDALWPEGGARGKTAFHTALSRLRRALRNEDQTTQFILVEAGEYWLDAARFSVDVDAFNTALTKARNASGEQAAYWYERAVNLYGGEYMDNLYYEWLMPERRRLERELLNAISALATYHLSANQPGEALLLIQRGLQSDSLQEHLHCMAMRCHAMLGDRVALVRQYRQLEMLLRDELNTDPENSTHNLYQSLLKKVK